MKRIFLLFTVLVLVSCNLEENIAGFFQDNDEKSEIVVKLADSYLAGNFDIARDYFTPDGKHYFNNLEFDVNGIIDGYNNKANVFFRGIFWSTEVRSKTCGSARGVLPSGLA